MKKIIIKTKVVIFDMDGVITDTMPDHFKAWKIIFAQEGIHVSHEDVYRREGQRGIDSVREIFAAHGKSVSRQQATNILKRKEKLFKKIVRVRFIKGSRKFLKDLYRHNFLLALVTGTARHEVVKILPVHLSKLFNVMITGSDVKEGKPHPEPFQRALKLLNIKPADAVVVENAPFGIRSAKAARLRCIAIETSLPRSFLNEADYIFSSVGDLEKKTSFILRA
ncbi:MAG: HAD family phosphatase [Candidatus Omnitrophota bacterium]